MRSIVLALLALACMGAGMLLTPVPVVGTVFSFAAPALALAGVIVGGIDVSRGRRSGKSNDVALAGAILSALCFFPALVTTLTCGVCNALWSATPVEVRRDMHFDIRNNSPLPPVHGSDGGAPSLPPPPLRSPSGPSRGGGAHGQSEGARPNGQATQPPAIPPPPLPAGPKRGSAP